MYTNLVLSDNKFLIEDLSMEAFFKKTILNI